MSGWVHREYVYSSLSGLVTAWVWAVGGGKCACVVCVYRGPHESCVECVCIRPFGAVGGTVIISGCTGSSSWSGLAGDLCVIGFLFFRAAVEFLCTEEHIYSTTDCI